MNRILRLLTIADIMLYSGLGLSAPIFAIFVERDIPGGSIAVAGFAQTLFLLVKALAQLAVARFTDRDVGYVREYWTALFGYALTSVAAFSYLGVSTVTGLYAVQVLLGLAGAFEYPGWMVLFTRFTARQHEGREWTGYATAVILGMAVTAGLGGWAAERYGFDTVFTAAGILAALGACVFAVIGRDYRRLQRDGVKFQRMPEPHETEVV